MNLERLTRRLKREEGERKRKGRHVPYRDTVGKLTIGYGRNLDDAGLSDYEAELLLRADIQEKAWHAIYIIGEGIWDRLDDVRREILVELCFNLGPTGLSGFKRMLGAVARSDWASAAREVLDSKAARQLPLRYNRLAYRMRTGSGESPDETEMA